MPQQGWSPVPQSPDLPVHGPLWDRPTHGPASQPGLGQFPWPCPVILGLCLTLVRLIKPDPDPHLWTDVPPGLGPTLSWSLRTPQWRFFYLSTFPFSTSYCEVSLIRSLKFPCLSHSCHHLWVSPAIYQVFTKIVRRHWLFSRKPFPTFPEHGQALANAYCIIIIFFLFTYADCIGQSIFCYPVALMLPLLVTVHKLNTEFATPQDWCLSGSLCLGFSWPACSLNLLNVAVAAFFRITYSTLKFLCIFETFFNIKHRFIGNLTPVSVFMSSFEIKNLLNLMCAFSSLKSQLSLLQYYSLSKSMCK